MQTSDQISPSLGFSIPNQMTKLSQPHVFYTCFEDCRHVFYFLSAFWAARDPLTDMGVLVSWAGLLCEHSLFSALEDPLPKEKHLGTEPASWSYIHSCERDKRVTRGSQDKL